MHCMLLAQFDLGDTYPPLNLVESAMLHLDLVRRFRTNHVMIIKLLFKTATHGSNGQDVEMMYQVRTKCRKNNAHLFRQYQIATSGENFNRHAHRPQYDLIVKMQDVTVD